MLLKFCTVFFFIPGWMHSTVHDFHVSRSELQYEPTEHAIQAIIHVFADDLARAVIPAEKSWMAIPQSTADSLVVEYFGSHFRVLCGKVPVPCHFIGREFTEDKSVLRVALDIRLDSKPDHIVIENTILVDLFADQRNILVWKRGQERGEVFMLDRKKKEISIPVP